MRRIQNRRKGEEETEKMKKNRGSSMNENIVKMAHKKKKRMTYH